MRMNENIERLVLHFHFINLLHRISILLLVFLGEISSYKFSSYLNLLLYGGIIYKLIYYIWYKFYQIILWKILMKFRIILSFYFSFLFFADDRGMKTKNLKET